MSLLRRGLDANFRRCDLMYDLIKVNKCCKYYVIFSKTEGKYMLLVFHFLGAYKNYKLFNVGDVDEENLIVIGGSLERFFVFDENLFFKYIKDNSILSEFKLFSDNNLIECKLFDCFLIHYDKNYEKIMRMYFSNFYLFDDSDAGLLYAEEDMDHELYEMHIKYEASLLITAEERLENLYYNDDLLKDEVYFTKVYCNCELNEEDQSDGGRQYIEYGKYNKFYNGRYNRKYRGKYLMYLRFMRFKLIPIEPFEVREFFFID